MEVMTMSKCFDCPMTDNCPKNLSDGDCIEFLENVLIEICKRPYAPHSSEAIPSADTFEITKEALIETIDNAETVGDIIEKFITADRPQGEWIYDVEAESKGYYWANCSQCGLQIDVHENRGYYNYCPNCGAKMK